MAVFCLYELVPGTDFLRIPSLPIATIGTAVAFYIGFKNNSAYERFWEGRKIWGGIVNSSRTWAAYVNSYVHPDDESEEAREERRVLVYRHLAWVNALRMRLRKTSRFFDKPVRTTRLRMERHAKHMRNDWDQEISPFLSPEELYTLQGKCERIKNTLYPRALVHPRVRILGAFGAPRRFLAIGSTTARC